MKIIYSAGNRIGAGIQMLRFLRHLGDKHEVRIAAYLKSSLSLKHIDWTLDGASHEFSSRRVTDLRKIFDDGKFPHICVEAAELLMAEVHKFDPDLVICDGENIMASIAAHGDYPLWYVSPLHLLDGLKWGPGQLRYKSCLNAYQRMLSRLPEAEKVFIYSPFCNFDIPLKKGYEWVAPYHHDTINDGEDNIAIIRDNDRVSELSKILNCVPPFNIKLFSKAYYDMLNLTCVSIQDISDYKKFLSSCRWLLTTGETSYIADALYAGVPNICIAPNIEDPEALLNAIILSTQGLGDNVGQVEKMGRYAIDKIASSIKRKRGNNMALKNIAYLHERIV